MATAQRSAPDQAGALLAFLLSEYLAQLGDPRYSEEERYELRLRLEYQIERQIQFAPGFESDVLKPIQLMFARLDLSERALPAVEWYLDFLSGRGEQWLSVAGIERHLLAFVHGLPLGRMRDRALQVLLLVDLEQYGYRPAGSYTCREFRESVLDQQGELNDRGRALARFLLREALAAPVRGGSSEKDKRSFCIDVLRYSLRPKAGYRRH